MSDSPKSAAITAFATIVGAIIAAVGGVAAVWVGLQKYESSGGEGAPRVATRSVDQTSSDPPTTSATRAPAPPARPDIEGNYVWLSQNFSQPSPPRMGEMWVNRDSDGVYSWRSRLDYYSEVIESQGRLARNDGAWTLSVDASNNPNVLTPEPIPAQVSLDDRVLNISAGGRQMTWRKR
jgi:hypothetical protein